MTDAQWLQVLSDPTATADDWRAWSWWLRDEAGDVEGAEAVEMCVGEGHWPAMSCDPDKGYFWYRHKIHPISPDELGDERFDRLDHADRYSSLAYYPDPLAACRDLARVLREDRAAADAAAVAQGKEGGA